MLDSSVAEVARTIGGSASWVSHNVDPCLA